MMMPRKKRRMLIISTIVICIVAIIAILVALYINTDMFKSNETLFEKYISQNFENISKMEYEEQLKEGKYISETELKLNYVQNIGTTLESSQNPINQLKIKIDGQTDKENNYNHQDITLTKDKDEISEIKYIQNGNIIGIEFSDMFNQYVLANNENLKTLFKQAELSEEQLSKIPDQIELDNSLEELITFSKEEKENIEQRYLNIISSNIKNSKFSKVNNTTIQINGKNVNVNGYSLTLTKEKLNNIYIKILEELKQDEVILAKIDKIQETLEQYKFIFGEIINIKNEFTTEIQYLIDDITKNNIGNEECKIIVYENNYTTVKTVIQGVGYEINFDILNNNYIMISYINNQEKQTIEKSLIINKENGETNIIYELAEGEKTTKYSAIINEEISGNNYNKTLTAKYEDDSNRVEFNMQNNIQMVQELEEITFNNENSVNLSELQQEQVKAIIDRINTAVTEKINEIQENVINTQNIDEILIAIKLMKEGQTIEGQGVTETEKNRFNSKFEILQGEDLNNEAVLNIINAIKDNLVELEPISGTELKLKLDRFNKNEEAFNTIINFIQNSKNKTYNAKIEYDETTGLAEDILLTMIEKKK